MIDPKHPELMFPKCPKCQTKLIRVLGHTILCSYPPYYYFACDACQFQGYVALEHIEVEALRQTAKAYKIARGVELLNEDWIVNIRNTMEQPKEVNKIQQQIALTRKSLLPESLIIDGCVAVTDLIEMMFVYLEDKFMDKKMHKVTEKIKTAGKDLGKGKKAAAVTELKSAAKANEKLVRIDRDVRDPMIAKCKKGMKAKKK